MASAPDFDRGDTEEAVQNIDLLSRGWARNVCSQVPKRVMLALNGRTSATMNGDRPGDSNAFSRARGLACVALQSLCRDSFWEQPGKDNIECTYDRSCVDKTRDKPTTSRRTQAPFSR